MFLLLEDDNMNNGGSDDTQHATDTLGEIGHGIADGASHIADGDVMHGLKDGAGHVKDAIVDDAQQTKDDAEDLINGEDGDNQ